MNLLRALATEIRLESVSLPSGQLAALTEWIVPFAEANPNRLSPGVLSSSYTSKPLVEVDGASVFGELAIVRLLERDGWSAVWADTYHGKFWRGMPHESQPVELPPEAAGVYHRIAGNKGSPSGCFDVIAWHDGHTVFLEYKGPRDRPNKNEPAWIESALQVGVPPEDLLLVAATRPGSGQRRQPFDPETRFAANRAPGAHSHGTEGTFGPDSRR